MGVDLIVMRPSGSQIAFLEWMQIVDLDPGLRMRGQSYEAVNPRTGEQIRMRAGEADAELRLGDHWRPFLRYSHGELAILYEAEFDNPQNPVRLKIAAVARSLQAVITTDAGDALLNW
jgi:hypothetical protein